MDPVVRRYRLEKQQRFPLYYAWNDHPRRFTFRRFKQSKIHPLDVGILVIVDEKTDLREYLFALDSLTCYANMHAYPLEIVRDTVEWRRRCPQSSIMFRRHCIVANLLNRHEWTLFLDADTGVVNPEKLIEEWIDSTVHLVMYDRFYNWEIAAGSYIARNSDISRRFLHGFADYEFRIPASFHGWDNGALHAFILEWSHFPSSHSCFELWTRSKSWDDLFTFEACTRTILQYPEDLKILKKGSGWMRDGWLTVGRWNPETDFMIHGWKAENLVPPRLADVMGELNLDQLRLIRFAGWLPPFTSRFDQNRCRSGKSVWHFNSDLVTSKQDIRNRLEAVNRKVESEFQKSLKRLNESKKFF